MLEEFYILLHHLPKSTPDRAADFCVAVLSVSIAAVLLVTHSSSSRAELKPQQAVKIKHDSVIYKH